MILKLKIKRKMNNNSMIKIIMKYILLDEIQYKTKFKNKMISNINNLLLLQEQNR